MTRWSSFKAALKSGAWKSWLATALTAAVGFGVLNSEQVDLVNNLVAGAVTLLGIAMSLFHTFHAAKLIRATAPAPLSFPDE